MKVVLLHQHFRTPETGGGIRTYHFARTLVARGVDVEVIAAHNDFRAQTVMREGFTIHYLPVFYANRLSFVARLRAFARFGWLALRQLRQIPGVRLVYAVTTPLSVPLLAWWHYRLRGVPYGVEIGDLWPEVPIRMGYFRARAIQKVLYYLEKRVYRDARMLVPYSIGMEPYVARVAPGVPRRVIPNLADCDFFRPEPKSGQVATSLGLGETFVVGYFGTAGKANHLEYLLAAAGACLRAVGTRITFLLAVEGAQRARLAQLAAPLANVLFVPYTDKAGVRQLLSVTDACYISFLDVPALATGSPNKYFDALAAGKLCLVNVGGWMRAEVEEARCGFYADPHAPTDFLPRLWPYVVQPTRLRAAQQRARQLAQTRYEARQLCQTWADFVLAHA